MSREWEKRDNEYRAALDREDQLYASNQRYKAKVRKLRDALRFIAAQENLTFAECSLAEEIVSRAKAALI